MLGEELARRRPAPRAVYISPSSDPFPPLAEVQAETAAVVEVLAEHGVQSWLMTRGYIRPTVLRRLAVHREKVRITVGLTTLDRHLRRVLEPLAAPATLRLRQIAQLRQLGFRVQVALEPLVPGLTDTRANLTTLLQALAGAGVRQVTVGYLFLRPGIQENLRRALELYGWSELVLGCYAKGPVLAQDSIRAARYLPRTDRQRGYAALMALAAGQGITVTINGLTNPDFSGATRQPDPVRRRIGASLFPHTSP
jgi:DNA repair photolyase